MIRTVVDLIGRVNSQIKVVPNTQTTKTQAADVKQLLLDILDTVNDLVYQQGLSLSNNIDQQGINLLASINQDLVDLNTTLQNYVLTQLPDLTTYAKKVDIPSYDLSVYQKVSDTIAYSRLTNIPTQFSGNYIDLTNKPTLFNGSYTTLTNKPTLVTSYTQLTDKPTIPDVSLYRLKSDTIDYTTLSNKPTIVTDYAQLINKPSMSKLLWNQTVGFSYVNSIVETNVLVPTNGTGTLSIDANPSIGTTFRLTGRGLFTTQSINLGSNLAIKLYLGNALIATGSISSFLLGAVNKPLSFYIDMLVTGTNTVYTQGSMSYFATALDSLSAAPILNGSGSNATVDFSTSNILKMTLTWNTANSANIIQTKIVNLEKLNN